MAYLISNPQFNIWNISYITTQYLLTLHKSLDSEDDFRSGHLKHSPSQDYTHPDDRTSLN